MSNPAHHLPAKITVEDEHQTVLETFNREFVDMADAIEEADIILSQHPTGKHAYVYDAFGTELDRIDK